MTNDNDDNGYYDDCPVCLDTMDKADYKHPLQCESQHCAYNFCMTCVESLISSSKDDYEEASDGSKQVKVSLRCPYCRFDLGPSIRETLLLRKADFLLLNEEFIDDSELTASQLRLKGVLHNKDVQDAIRNARKREIDFFKKHPKVNINECDLVRTMSIASSFCRSFDSYGGCSDIDRVASITENSSFDSYDEEGVEADIKRGVHQSFRTRKSVKIQELLSQEDQQKVDFTLFQGYEDAMSEEEQKYVTELMTSGETHKLAQAAQILYGIAQMISSPPKPISKEKKKQGRPNRSSSVYYLIEEIEESRDHQNSNSTSKDNTIDKEAQEAAKRAAALAAKRNRAYVINENMKKQQAAIMRRLSFLKSYPLPVRIPKFVEIEINSSYVGGTNYDKNFPLKFCDDRWDGTCSDAFRKITVYRKIRVQKKELSVKSKNRNVIYVLSEGRSIGDDVEDNKFYVSARIDMPKDRVLISSVKDDRLSRFGVLKGDVVTHINGEEFVGNTEQLHDILKTNIKRIHETTSNNIDSASADGCGGGGENNSMCTLSLVLNAERSIAEALKRRAVTISVSA